jgi:hypothetical protein
VRVDARDLGQEGAERQAGVEDGVALVRPEALSVEPVEPQRESSQSQRQDVI